MGKEPVSPEGNEKFGAEVRRLRVQAGLSQAQLASLLPLSQTAVSDIELGKTAAKRDQAERLDQVLDSGGHLVALWKSNHDGFRPPEWYKKVPEMERRATEIQDYHPLVVPGLLQTEPYAKAAIAAADRVAATEGVAAKARARVKRQEVLEGQTPPFFLAVIDESVLYRRLGSAEIMREQLERLHTVSTWQRTEILIVPWRTWDHPGLDGAFHMLKVPEAGTVLYQETRSMGSVVIDPKVVEVHVALMGHLRGVALPPDQSRSLIRKVQEEYT